VKVTPREIAELLALSKRDIKASNADSFDRPGLGLRNRLQRHPADLDPILELAEEMSLIVIEDACHALGAEYKGQSVGSICDMTVFSFHPVKHITTGEGGMVSTDDEEKAARMRRFRNHGIAGDARQRQAKGQWYYEMADLGYNYRLTDIGCALGLSQMRKLEGISPVGEDRRSLQSRIKGYPGHNIAGCKE